MSQVRIVYRGVYRGVAPNTTELCLANWKETKIKVGEANLNRAPCVVEANFKVGEANLN